MGSRGLVLAQSSIAGTVALIGLSMARWRKDNGQHEAGGAPTLTASRREDASAVWRGSSRAVYGHAAFHAILRPSAACSFRWCPVLTSTTRSSACRASAIAAAFAGWDMVHLGAPRCRGALCGASALSHRLLQ